MSKYADLFQQLDSDGSRSLCFNELKKAINDKKPGLSDEQIKEIIGNFDKDKDGKLDLEEFTKLMDSLA